MLPKVVLTDANMRMLRNNLADLEKIANVVVTPDDAEETLLKEIVDADLLIICYAPVPRSVIAEARRLKAILKWGVGVDTIDLAAATQYAIPVYHCPHYGSVTVAEHAFALMIGLARKLVPLHNEMRRKGWMWPEPPYLGSDLAGKTIGLIGFGRIGRAMARMCLGFDMTVLVFDPHVALSTESWPGVVSVDLRQLLEQSDVVSIHCVLTETSRDLIGSGELAWMKKSAFLINVSRAAIVTETALVQSLERGEIAGAGLDVFWEEPVPPDHPILGMDNVIISPHFAYYTREADQRLDRDTLEAAKSILRGERLADIKNPEVFSSTRCESA